MSMLQIFFRLINCQSYKYPSQFSSDCSQGVIDSDDDAYTYYNKNNLRDHEGQKMRSTFCPESEGIKLRFQGYSDKLHYGVKTEYGEKKGGCDKDGSPGCCSVGDNYENGNSRYFYPHKCYPWWFTLESNCYNEKDWMEVLYNDNRLRGQTYKCNDYDNCKGFYYGSNCQNSVPSYDETYNCKVSLGTEGDGSCNCYAKTSITTMQDYCLDKYSPNGINIYWREYPSDDWTFVRTYSYIELTRSDDNYYNQFRLHGKLLFTDKNTHYYFQFRSTTPAKVKIGSKTCDESNFVHCDPNGALTCDIDYGNPSNIGFQEVEVIIDTGCSLNQPEGELFWKRNSGSYSYIPKKYVFHD